MVKSAIKFYVIQDVSCEYKARDDEYFDTFEEAYSHINDKDENGRFKYYGWWCDEQECKISERVITPKIKTITEVAYWHYKGGKQVDYTRYIEDPVDY